jgi:hypothetical protein
MESVQGERKIDHMWMAMAMDVGTRLWLGGVVNVQRNKGLILSLAQKVRSCAKSWNFLLFCRWSILLCFFFHVYF